MRAAAVRILAAHRLRILRMLRVLRGLLKFAQFDTYARSAALPPICEQGIYRTYIAEGCGR